ncbi:MAG TPA: VWA domain-containing protein, partial [Polyangiaceae bacterium]|nr:VWA domain-containing protein [Polyangiaceae bacterium]
MLRILGSLKALRSTAAGVGVLLVAGACSGGKDAGDLDNGRAPAPDISLNLGGSQSGPGTTVNGGLTANGCDVMSTDAVCAAQAYEGEAIPLDIYIMFDQSGSMLNDVGGLTRLDAVERATRTFLRDEASAAIRVGVGYFGFAPIGQTSCAADDYATPSVPVTLDHEAVLSSLAAREPTGETPT